ncbi:serpin A3-5-like [Notolabrus celidotus]|uniref:serpin A3-5-like n=1 Tax=Notolabrus celidotus TaxID=1203425 RepID=UPI00148F97CA|nr:serpin A3-5-like [Notolabrus celidotus]
MMHATLSIWILSAVICMGRGHHHIGHAEAADPTDQDTAENSVSQLISGNKQFGFRLYKKLAAHADSEGKNIFYSPVSVSLALAALSVGARGETHRQLFSGLGYNNPLLTQTDVDQAFQTILERVNQTLNEDISEGTAVFVDNSFKARPEFLETLRQSYLADGFNVDFTKTKDSVNTINKYVEGKTNGKIDNLVDSMDPSTVMYLISYIYYKGKWATPFSPHLTRADEFMVDENTKVPVQMMNMEEILDTYHDQAINTSVLHLPFNNSYSMLLLLPDDMATLENAICPAHITKWIKWMKPRMHDVYVPKFSIKSSYSLKSVLSDMGMTDMFGDSADLSGISEGQKLAVSEVVHQATLDVDEAGATAAAATGVGITLLSLRFVPVMRFNRPFMVVIIERNTENILFLGKIINPNI